MNIKTLKVGMLETNCYILSSQNKILIIDPGGDAEKIADAVNEYVKDDTEVRIINTHYHYDHTLANDELREFFELKVLIHEHEKNFIEFEADVFLKEGDHININDSSLEVIHTPGHSKGCVSLLGEDFIFVGDTIFKEGFGRTDLPGGDMEEMQETLKKLSHIIKPDMTVYPGHGDKFIWEE